MKLRISGNSLRYRVSRSELARFLDEGRIAEEICFGTADEARLSYALERSSSVKLIEVRYAGHEVSVVVPDPVARSWATTEQVGIEGEVDLGDRGVLDVLIEKDFACLDRDAEANADMFPNPLAGKVC